MRFITTLVLGTALALPAMAQTTPMPAKPKAHHTMRHATSAMQRETVDDKGPFTPEANRAYEGGGMVTDSAPSGMSTAPMQPMAPMR